MKTAILLRVFAQDVVYRTKWEFWWETIIGYPSILPINLNPDHVPFRNHSGFGSTEPISNTSREQSPRRLWLRHAAQGERPVSRRQQTRSKYIVRDEETVFKGGRTDKQLPNSQSVSHGFLRATRTVRIWWLSRPDSRLQPDLLALLLNRNVLSCRSREAQLSDAPVTGLLGFRESHAETFLGGGV